jgi:hypothetical protein
VTQAQQLASALEPGTPLLKVVPPRLVEPYLTGRRSVIAGYVYRAADCPFADPGGYYAALGLSYEGSDFRPDMPELYLLRWLALDMSASLLPVPAGGPPGPRVTVPEYFTLPVPVPVGAELHRVTYGGEELAARYDGQVWLVPRRGQ